VNHVKSRKDYLLSADQLRLGLAGNLANFPFENAKNQSVTGQDIPYGDQPTGYALDPADTTNYVLKHDNQTFWDNNQYRLPFDTSTKYVVELTYSHSPFQFLHKAFYSCTWDHDFCVQNHSYATVMTKVTGVIKSISLNKPITIMSVYRQQIKKKADWPLINKLLVKNEEHDSVRPSEIAFSAEIFKEFMRLRMSTPLCRLTNSEEIIKRVKFHNTAREQQTCLLACL
jgi:pullulanase